MTLVSDPGTKGIQIQIVRPRTTPRRPARQHLQDLPVTSQPYLAEGLGTNQMEINGINKSDATPLPGDLVCLTDGDWWANAQHMVVGQIESVGTQENQPLRHSIKVVPRVALSTQRTVMIVLQGRPLKLQRPARSPARARPHPS